MWDVEEEQSAVAVGGVECRLGHIAELLQHLPNLLSPAAWGGKIDVLIRAGHQGRLVTRYVQPNSQTSDQSGRYVALMRGRDDPPRLFNNVLEGSDLASGELGQYTRPPVESRETVMARSFARGTARRSARGRPR